MKSLVRPELPTASVGSSQALTTAVDNSAPFSNSPQSTYKSGRAVQTNGATSKLDYTRPGKPTDNGLIGSFNGRRRDEFLNVNEFITMHEVHETLRAWQDDYNHCLSHGALGHLTPSEFVAMRSGRPKEAARL